MNSAIKAAIFHPQTHLGQMRLAMFHSTPVLERRRRSYVRSDEYSNAYSKRFRKMQSKKTLLDKISFFADYLFKALGYLLVCGAVLVDLVINWTKSRQKDLDEDDSSTSKGPSWFKEQYSGRSKKGWNQGHQYSYKRGFQFCEDDDEIDVDAERFSGSGFGRSRCYYWSFTKEENTKWRSSSSYHYEYTYFGNSRARLEEEYESSTESDNLDSDIASDRQALGLSAYGPLKLEEVKTAYRVCALKWHPDRHQGSSKVLAAEKFKLCSQAYKSLCDKVAAN